MLNAWKNNEKIINKFSNGVCQFSWSVEHAEFFFNANKVAAHKSTAYDSQLPQWWYYALFGFETTVMVSTNCSLLHRLKACNSSPHGLAYNVALLNSLVRQMQ